MTFLLVYLVCGVLTIILDHKFLIRQARELAYTELNIGMPINAGSMTKWTIAYWVGLALSEMAIWPYIVYIYVQELTSSFGKTYGQED